MKPCLLISSFSLFYLPLLSPSHPFLFLSISSCFSITSLSHHTLPSFLLLISPGRSKEIINRGGETISPFEIEEAVQQYPSVKEVLAFSAPHEQVHLLLIFLFPLPFLSHICFPCISDTRLVLFLSLLDLTSLSTELALALLFPYTFLFECIVILLTVTFLPLLILSPCPLSFPS